MNDLINLKRVRKQKARSEAEAAAQANRAAHGRTKVEKKLSRAEKERAAKRLDASRREPNG